MAGINKLLYNKENENQELDKLLTKEEVMEHLHINNYKTFVDLISKQKLPYIKVGKQYLIPLSEYKKWLKKNIYN